jgi:hypothetical protein
MRFRIDFYYSFPYNITVPKQMESNMIDYKNCTSKQFLRNEETPFEALLTGVVFLFCLGAAWAVLALVSF